jgi:hypothetical protein
MTTHVFNGAVIAAVPDLAEMSRTGGFSGPDSLRTNAGVMIAVLGVVLLIAGWAVFLRKPARRRERGRLVDAAPREPESGSKGGRRRRRRMHRGRNPTLAETGGLPALRDGSGPEHRP